MMRAGIARIMQTGWFKEVRVKDLDSHSVRALLASRALLVKAVPILSATSSRVMIYRFTARGGYRHPSLF